jgi:[ribosomal protein S5]-alanine N-acetyltransferase
VIVELPATGPDSIVDLFVLRPDDVTDVYVGWLNDGEVNQYLESRFMRHTVETTRAFVADQLASSDTLFLGIRMRPSGRHVGNIKIGPINALHRTAEIGILIGDKTAWGRGVATATIGAVARIAERSLSLRKITAGCYASNIGSKRAFEKAGFAVEGVRPRQLLLNGAPEDMIVMGRCLA